MTAATDIDLRDVEKFLYLEARLADEHAYDAWEALWTDDAIYWVPAGSGDSDPETQMSVIYDNRNRISTRLRQLHTGRRHSQNPVSSTRRLITNVELLDGDGADLTVGANFMVVESRERNTETWAGRYTYRLRRLDGEWRMAFKKVALVDVAHVLPTLSFLI